MKLSKHFYALIIGFAMTFSTFAAEIYGFRIPDEAAGFIARPSVDNEKEQAGLGYFIPYADTNKISTVSVFIYNHQLKTIPSGISPLLRKVAENANADVLSAQPYARLITNAQVDEMEGVPYIFYKYEFPAEANKAPASISYMYMLAINNYFIKVRISRPDFSATEAPTALMMNTMLRIDTFMHQLVLSLKASNKSQSNLH